MSFQLREYQQDCVDIIEKNFMVLQSQLVQLPTGSGKTVILWSFIKKSGMKALICAPTLELTEQLYETGCAIVGEDKVHLKKTSFISKNRHVIMTSQALTFMIRHDSFPEFDILIIDEAHKSHSPSYEKVINKLIKKTKRKILGLTATPERLDGKNLLEIFNELTYSKSFLDMIENGWLVDIDCYKVKTKIKADLKSKYGDIQKNQLIKLDQTTRNELIRKVALKDCKDKKTLIFCLSVDHAKKIAKMLKESGVKSEAIDGSMPKSKRREILEKYQKKEIQYLCNCQLLAEGFDDPSIEALILARPTKSKALFCQMIGRGVRPYPGKKKCSVYDFSDEIHNICSFNVLGGISPYSNFELREGESFFSGVQRYKENYNDNGIPDVEIELFRHDLFGISKELDKPAMDNQIQYLIDNDLPYFPCVSIKEAAFLKFKNELLVEYGYDQRDYWERWKKDIPSSNT